VTGQLAFITVNQRRNLLVVTEKSEQRRYGDARTKVPAHRINGNSK
jgi:hypothetical protein